MAAPNKRIGTGGHLLLISLGLIDLGLIIRYFLRGTNVALFNPKGLIAQQQLDLILYTAGVLLVIAIPTFLLIYFIAWKYRESNTRAKYDPVMQLGKWHSFGLWVIPSVFISMIAVVMVFSTHKLAPQKAIVAESKSMTIQVVALRWKWLFIYPEQKIASLNFVQIPVGTPVTFELTSDEAPMSSFWIPNLGGQLYTMTGHVNRLNLMADSSGDYPGSSAEINGAGFSKMKFTARASSSQDFDLWVQGVKNSKDRLDLAAYEHVLRPSENNPAVFYSSYEDDLYDTVVAKYTGSARSHISH